MAFRLWQAATVALVMTTLAGCPAGNPGASQTPQNVQASVKPGADGKHPELHGVTVSPDRDVRQGDTITLRANATHPEARPLTYSWSATGGKLSANSGQEVRWEAPNTPGTHGVTVIVSDDQGGTAEYTQRLFPISDS